MLDDEEDVGSSLEILLTTVQGERVMLPQYGCNLDEMVFENLDTRLRTLLADKIETAILYHEPRVELQGVLVRDHQSVEGVVLIEITYRVRSTNSRFNFVFPYYRLEGTDINLATTLTLLPD